MVLMFLSRQNNQLSRTNTDVDIKSEADSVS